MAKTRGRPAASAEKDTTDSKPIATGQKTPLKAEVSNPPQLFILPENLGQEARIVQLENARQSTNSSYLVCPETGFYEFTRIAAPKSTPRSWLLSQGLDTPDNIAKGEEGAESKLVNNISNDGYVLRNANLLVATPIDSLFLMLPALTSKSETKGAEKKLFLSGEDYLEKLASDSPDIRPLLKNESVRVLLEKRMAAICDTVDAGDETMYRISEEKLLIELMKKAERMVMNGLTPSLEEKFVKKALDVPTPLVIVEEEVTKSTLSTPQAETPDTQSTTLSGESLATSFSEASTAATSFSEESSITTTKVVIQPVEPSIEAPEGVADLLRLRTALSFICSKYLSPKISETIKSLANSSASAKDFTPLDNHLAHLAKLRQEALATRSLGDASRKRCFDDEDEEGNGESRAEKKRKKEEEEKRKKAGESRGVKNLKKVNVSGMKKMSDFFKKK
ncbi:hypothetical protein GLAREA_00152 [Glarea lozoyensis ATCC 20868]|uniref:Ribonuclease H2 subunit B n=2 Tax=Glarea lozoyensis TaxID=101852 RepID=S3CVL1_GLAL2|nr:uncharacterized protein GLAREA_00152 [Glarea lozoyensis ATCC 20868]EPE28994.1 hypothetical protein GLAREA_00152 [Glarea lozoyensis ATCC 20868]